MQFQAANYIPYIAQEVNCGARVHCFNKLRNACNAEKFKKRFMLTSLALQINARLDSGSCTMYAAFFVIDKRKKGRGLTLCRPNS